MNRERSRGRNILLSVLLLVGIALSLVTVAFATAPDPGHNFTEVGGGVVQGNLLYGSAADTLSALPKDTNATRYLSNTGGGVNNPAWAQVNVANGVTGLLPNANLANGAVANLSGTNTGDQTTITGNAGTATSLAGGLGGQILYQNGAGTTAFLANGVAGQVLSSNGTTLAPSWIAAGTGTVTAVSIATANGFSGSSSGGATPALTITAGVLTPTTVNGLTLAAAGTGFTIAGGSGPSTLTVTGNATISGTPLSNPMTTLGDIIYGGAAGVATRLGGAAGFLKSTGAAAPTFSTVNLAAAADVGATVLPTANGGTGQSANWIPGGIIFGSTATVLNDTAVGVAGQVLQSAGAGTPTWATGKILIGRQVKVAGNTTYVPTAGTTGALIQMCGAGGGGAGGLGAATPSTMVGGGGGSGGYLEKYITFSSLSANYVINIPAGGAGGIGAAGGSTPATNTTFACDATCSSNLTFTAFSGAGAAAPTVTGTTVLPSNPGAGGAISTNGDVNTKGQPGLPGFRFSATISISGAGGPSYFGGGGNPVTATAAGGAGGFCAGGSGALSLLASSQTGGLGGAGTMIVWEFD